MFPTYCVHSQENFQQLQSRLSQPMLESDQPPEMQIYIFWEWLYVNWTLKLYPNCGDAGGGRVGGGGGGGEES